MGANTKSLRNRIKSVKSTLHLTKAMGLVASSKIRKAQEARVKSQQYASSLGAIVDVLAKSQECVRSPYITPVCGEKREKAVVIAGDRGLAGGYNVNVFRFVRELGIAELHPIGKKACERYGQAVCSSERFSYEEAYKLALQLCDEFKSGKYSEISMISTKYVSMISQEPQKVCLLPLTCKEGGDDQGGAVFEPGEMAVLEKAVPIYVAGLIYAGAKESFACEVVARRSAMDSAGKNATTMIDNLQLKYNRARQGAITQEITEIVAGSGE